MNPTLELRVQQLCIDYAVGRKRLRAVDDVSLGLRSGSTLGIVGGSGSGKSTLALAMLGLLDRRTTQLAGSIHFQGRDLATLQEPQWRQIRGAQIGAVFQSPQGSFNPTLTIGEHLVEAACMRFGDTGARARQRALQALADVGMPRAEQVLGSHAFELSGGMCQRAAIALALVQQPSLLIADEPTSSLDVVAQVEICRLLQRLNRQHGLSMIVISHDLGLVGQLADQVEVMHRGQVVESGRTEDLFERPQHPYTRQLLAAAGDLDDVRDAQGARA